jgi:hypothetical protein
MSVSVEQRSPAQPAVRPLRVVVAASGPAIAGFVLVLLAVPRFLSGLSSTPLADEGLDGPATTVARAAVDGGAGLVFLLAAIGIWQRRMWLGWWLAVAIFTVGLASTLLLSLNAVQHLNEQLGKPPVDLVIVGAQALLYAAGLWAVGTARAWFSAAEP